MYKQLHISIIINKTELVVHFYRHPNKKDTSARMFYRQISLNFQAMDSPYIIQIISRNKKERKLFVTFCGISITSVPSKKRIVQKISI